MSSDSMQDLESGGELSQRESDDLERIVVNLDDKSDQLKLQLTDVIATEIARTEELDALAEAAVDIQNGADTFQKSAQILNKKKRMEMIRSKVLGGIIVLCILVFLMTLICKAWQKISYLTSDSSSLVR